jgi:hypothetical protein
MSQLKNKFLDYNNPFKRRAYGVFMLFQLYRKNKELYAQLEEPGCPFRGFHAVIGSMTYFGGSLCAINDEGGLCKREIIGSPPNWLGCPLNTRMNRIAIEIDSERVMVLPRKIHILRERQEGGMLLADWISRTIGTID